MVLEFLIMPVKREGPIIHYLPLTDDIYKKLIFINRDANEAGYLMDSSGADADDVNLGELQNDFNLSGILSFTGTIKGEYLDDPKKVDEILTESLTGFGNAHSNILEVNLKPDFIGLNGH